MSEVLASNEESKCSLRLLSRIGADWVPHYVAAEVSAEMLLRRLNERPDDRPSTLTPLGERLQEHLGADPRHLPVVVEQVPPHRLIDLDLALEDVSAGTPSKTLGVTGGQARHHEDLASLIQNH